MVKSWYHNEDLDFLSMVFYLLLVAMQSTFEKHEMYRCT